MSHFLSTGANGASRCLFTPFALILSCFYDNLPLFSLFIRSPGAMSGLRAFSILLGQVTQVGYFPFFIELTEQPGLIVGGGTVALRKVEKLMPYGPRLTVVAPSFIPELASIRGVDLVQRSFQSSDLDGAFFVIAATDDGQLNHQISALCQSRGIPVNVVDDKQACTFLFPALVKRGDLSVGVSTGGASPTAAIWLKEQVSALLPEGLEDILAWLEQQRPLMKERFPQERCRAALFARLFSACMEAGAPLSDQEFENILQQEERL